MPESMFIDTYEARAEVSNCTQETVPSLGTYMLFERILEGLERYIIKSLVTGERGE